MKVFMVYSEPMVVVNGNNYWYDSVSGKYCGYQSGRDVATIKFGMSEEGRTGEMGK
jgi:hypothetical protein